jgi:hypothetical protein
VADIEIEAGFLVARGLGRRHCLKVPMEATMLERIAAEQIKLIAGLAKAARVARDHMLDKVTDEELGQPVPARGEHNPAAVLGLEPLPADHPARIALKEEIDGLPHEARRELLALMWIGRDDYAVADWERALASATTAFEVTAETLMDEADLDKFLLKGLYEMALM